MGFNSLFKNIFGVIEFGESFEFFHFIVFCVVEMRLIYFTLSQSLPKIKFDILSKTKFFSLSIKLIKQFNVIREIFRRIFL